VDIIVHKKTTIMIGGRSQDDDGFFMLSSDVKYNNDLYCYDPSINEWKTIEPRGIIPSPRSMHSATVVDRKMYIFGGGNSAGSSNDTSGYCDLYELDFDSMSWHECENDLA